jgi:glycosyltransferase involved in cell wall biosynthesis
MNENVTVVTVSCNNASGLRKTFFSLSNLTVKPFEVIVIDAISSDDTFSVVNQYSANLNIRFISEPDDGIYDAMNKGLGLVRTSLVHYLNGGDEVCGEPYLNLYEPILLPVIICDILDENRWLDKIKLLGFGYCHQGIIFPSNHRQYDTSYKYASDLDLIISVFPKGLQELCISNSGSAKYYLGGFSSINNKKGDQEILKIFRRQSGILQFSFIFFYINLKSLLPRNIRRWTRGVFG